MPALDAFANAFRDSQSIMLTLVVVLAAGTLAFAIMAVMRSRGSLKRRHARIVDAPRNPRHALRHSSARAVARIVDYTNKHYSGDQEAMRLLRSRLIQAGIYDPRGVALFFAGRAALAIVLAAAVFFVLPFLWPMEGSMLWLSVMVGGVAGYVGPSIYIDKRIKARTQQHRSGFPDFLDLLVVCSNAGLSMEASLERVSREMGESYPSLTANIHMTNLEIRAGRNLKDALERFAGRLALDEARAFATLINQSIDLGSSITDALRVYSDDMRHKRMSSAEEKAYALPAKLAVPMMICIFPVLFVVILLPVIVKLSAGHYF